MLLDWLGACYANSLPDVLLPILLANLASLAQGSRDFSSPSLIRVLALLYTLCTLHPSHFSDPPISSFAKLTRNGHHEICIMYLPRRTGRATPHDPIFHHPECYHQVLLLLLLFVVYTYYTHASGLAHIKHLNTPFFFSHISLIISTLYNFNFPEFNIYNRRHCASSVRAMYRCGGIVFRRLFKFAIMMPG